MTRFPARGGQLHRLDERLFGAVARARTPWLDSALPRLSRAADHGVLWFAAAAGLAATGPAGRRAATRGLASLAVASVVVNGPVKWSIRRPRPHLGVVPVDRLLSRQPATWSFPSGHSASAAAFAAGVMLELGPPAAPVAAVAGAVAFSRVYAGVHYPGDVLGGVALGVGAALAVRRRWRPAAADEPAEAATAPAPALPDGEGLQVVVNAAAGDETHHEMIEQLEAALPAAQVHHCDAAGDLADTLRAVAGDAVALGIIGGDGSIRRAAEVALDAGLPLAVIPGGTLNHFAADVGIGDLSALVEAVRAGTAAAVRVGTVESAGPPAHFVNTFALGVYPEIVQLRERREERLGKWPALALAVMATLARAEPLDVVLDGRPRRVWLVFVGNGCYEPAGALTTRRTRLDEGVLDVRVIEASRSWSRLMVTLAVLARRLDACPVYQQQVCRQLDVRLPEGSRLACDGEQLPAPRHLLLRPHDRSLVVYRPAR